MLICIEKLVPLPGFEPGFRRERAFLDHTASYRTLYLQAKRKTGQTQKDPKRAPDVCCGCAGARPLPRRKRPESTHAGSVDRKGDDRLNVDNERKGLHGSQRPDS
jgi:hypothetical protein